MHRKHWCALSLFILDSYCFRPRPFEDSSADHMGDRQYLAVVRPCFSRTGHLVMVSSCRHYSSFVNHQVPANCVAHNSPPGVDIRRVCMDGAECGRNSSPSECEDRSAWAPHIRPIGSISSAAIAVCATAARVLMASSHSSFAACISHHQYCWFWQPVNVSSF